MADLDRAQVILVLNSGKNFRSVDLSGLNLSGLDFRGADLTNTNFSGSDLSNAIFGYGGKTNEITIHDITTKGIKGADFSNANLSSCYFGYCTPYGTGWGDYLSDQKLYEGVNFYNAILNKTHFIQRLTQTKYYVMKSPGNPKHDHYREFVAEDNPILLSENFVLPNGNYGEYIEQLSHFGASIERIIVNYIATPKEEKKRRGFFG